MSNKVDLARTVLRNVVDPELGLNIVDLGLIYDLRVEDEKAFVLMTFTTMGCPVAGALVNGVYDALEPLGFADIKVEVTYSPPWSPERMSDDARRRLGINR